MVMNRTGLIDPAEKMLQFILILCAGGTYYTSPFLISFVVNL